MIYAARSPHGKQKKRMGLWITYGRAENLSSFKQLKEPALGSVIA